MVWSAENSITNSSSFTNCKLRQKRSVYEEVKKLGEEEKTGGYKFAVAFLAASGSSLYIISKYLKNTPVDTGLYQTSCVLLAFGFISILGFLLYLLIKAYLMEDQGTDIGKNLNKLAPKLYSWSILFFIVSMPVTIYAIFIDSLPPETQKYFSIILGIIILDIIILNCVFIVFFRWHRSRKNSSSKKSGSGTSNLKSIILLEIFVIICFVFPFLVACYPPIQGHVTMDMKSIHYKNDTQIPVLIQVTGPNTGLSASLYQERSGTLYKIDYINKMEPIFLGSKSSMDKRDIESSNRLIGNYIGDGNYNVFINTTDLSAGYYELMCTRTTFYNTSTAKSFYLLNAKP